jgi:hypothetical protein
VKFGCLGEDVGRIVEHVEAAQLAGNRRHCLLKLEFWISCREWLVLRGRVKEKFGWISIHAELEWNIASLLSG